AELKTKIDAAKLTSLETHADEDGHEHEDQHADEHDDHGHEHEAGKNPHVWLDPVKYAEVAEGVGAAFAKADPDHAADCRKNTEALVGERGGLDARFDAWLKTRATEVFITTHAALGHLAGRYGLTEEAINGLDPESEPSGAR